MDDGSKTIGKLKGTAHPVRRGSRQSFHTGPLNTEASDNKWQSFTFSEYGVGVTIYRSEEDGRIALEIDGPAGIADPNYKGDDVNADGSPAMRVWLNEDLLYDGTEACRNRVAGRGFMMRSR